MPKVVPEYKAQARHRIVDAAQRVFARKGFGGATMDDIADEVGVSKGAIYLYFENKTELLKAIQAWNREQVQVVFEQLLNGEDLAEGLASMIDKFLSGDVDTAAWHSLMIEAQSDPAVREALRADQREDFRALHGFVERLRAAGRLPHIHDTEAATSVLIALLEHSAGQYLLGFDRRESRRALVQALRFVLAPTEPGGRSGARSGSVATVRRPPRPKARTAPRSSTSRGA